MSYEVRFEGEIVISQPIPWKKIRNSPFLSINSKYDVILELDETMRDTDEGIAIIKQAVAVRPTYPNYLGNLMKHLQELVDAFPEHEFTGRLDVFGEENGDIRRIKVVDRVVTEFTPTLVWPEESE